MVDTLLMTGELQTGAVVEIQVGKCVFVGVVVSADHLNVRLDMDGRFKTGTLISIYDPDSECAVQGKVFGCAPNEAGGFCLEVIRNPSEMQPIGDGLFVWPPHALQYAQV